MAGKTSAPPPITPGAVLRDEILARLGVTQDGLAAALGVSRFSVNQIINDRRSVTADMALRLATVLRTSPEFWLNLQQDLDVYRARQKAGDAFDRLDPIVPATEPDKRFVSADVLFG